MLKDRIRRLGLHKNPCEPVISSDVEALLRALQWMRLLASAMLTPQDMLWAVGEIERIERDRL